MATTNDRVSVDIILGSGDHRYRLVADWPSFPKDWTPHDVASVGRDRNDRIYLFVRGPRPVMVFDRDGNFLTAWGEGVFRHPHGVSMGPDETMYLTDDGDHTVRKCDLSGKVLLELGIPGKPAPSMSGRPFNRCTHTALSPRGDIYVSDGYENARIHKFDPAGRLLTSWGESGIGPGEFNVPHNVWCDRDGWVYVADRENHRIQIFDGNGKYETEWHYVHRPNALYMDGDELDSLCYVAEGGPPLPYTCDHPNLGARVTILSRTGERLAYLGGARVGYETGEFSALHGITVDSQGSIYAAEVSYTGWMMKDATKQAPPNMRVITKLEKIR